MLWSALSVLLNDVRGVRGVHGARGGVVRGDDQDHSSGYQYAALCCGVGHDEVGHGLVGSGEGGSGVGGSVEVVRDEVDRGEEVRGDVHGEVVHGVEARSVRDDSSCFESENRKFIDYVDRLKTKCKQV